MRAVFISILVIFISAALAFVMGFVVNFDVMAVMKNFAWLPVVEAIGGVALISGFVAYSRYKGRKAPADAVDKFEADLHAIRDERCV